MFSFIFYFFLAYMLYQLVFRFIIPVYRTTRQVKKSYRDMQEKMQNHQERTQKATFSKPHAQGKQPKNVGDYIDFEEVKD